MEQKGLGKSMDIINDLMANNNSLGQAASKHVSPQVSHETKMSQLSHKNVCDIIRTCRENDVSALRFRDLEISFASPKVCLTSSDRGSVVSDCVSHVSHETTSETFAVGDEKHTLQDRADQVQDEMADLVVSDPVAFENFMMSEDAVSDGDTA